MEKKIFVHQMVKVLMMMNSMIILFFYSGQFSDEGGHISDDRPLSRESTLNSEPEHE